jgi:hypothetical protein
MANGGRTDESHQAACNLLRNALKTFPDKLLAPGVSSITHHEGAYHWWSVMMRAGTGGPTVGWPAPAQWGSACAEKGSTKQDNQWVCMHRSGV